MTRSRGTSARSGIAVGWLALGACAGLLACASGSSFGPTEGPAWPLDGGLPPSGGDGGREGLGLDGDDSGALPPAAYRAGDRIEGEEYDVGQGVEAAAGHVGYFDAGDYYCFREVDFRGVTGVELYLAGVDPWAAYELRADGPRGTLLAAVTLTTPTGGWETFDLRQVAFTTTLSAVRDLCVVGQVGQGIIDLDYLILTGQAVTPDLPGDAGPPDAPPAGWWLVWSDEFEYDGLPDPQRWGYDVGGEGWGNNESQYYTESRGKNARVANGVLTITARRESYQGRGYTSARLVTRGKGDWLYGRVEVRARLPRGVGSWPAIWMLPTDGQYGGWPDSGEIDIMEHVGYNAGVVVGTVHTQAYNHLLGTQRGASINVSDAMDVFHVYAVEWEATQIRVFVDDICYFTFDNESQGPATWPFDRPFHLLLNIAIGGNWGGAQGIDDSMFPLSMEVDYVRVYERS